MTRILIVEDEDHLAEGLRFNLEAEGYETVRAADGRTASALLTDSEGRFDLVILDLRLPEMSGFEVARPLRGRSGAEDVSGHSKRPLRLPACLL